MRAKLPPDTFRRPDWREGEGNYSVLKGGGLEDSRGRKRKIENEPLTEGNYAAGNTSRRPQ
jgi:hypothetical protein